MTHTRAKWLAACVALVSGSSPWAKPTVGAEDQELIGGLTAFFNGVPFLALFWWWQAWKCRYHQRLLRQMRKPSNA